MGPRPRLSRASSTGIVADAAGRDVVAFMSNSRVGPDLEIELFVLAP